MSLVPSLELPNWNFAEIFSTEKLGCRCHGVVCVILDLAVLVGLPTPTCDGQTDRQTHDDSV